MTALFARPYYYYSALNLNPDEATSEDLKKAYAAMAGNGEHPDHGGDADRWTLITAAYNELKAIFSKKRGRYENKTDLAWKRHWDALGTQPAADPDPEPKAETPKTDKRKASKVTDGFVFENIEGEDKDARRRRYARERQAYRYANDPDFAASRRSSSKTSHSKTAKARKDAKAASAAE